MRKRLQILLDEVEWREIQRAARANRMTVAEWVRGTLRAARQPKPTDDVVRKLDVIRAAARHAFPTADVAQILAEVERGYLGGGSGASLR